MENNLQKHDESHDESPPVLSSWRKLYTAVFLNLVALIILFYIFTKIFD